MYTSPGAIVRAGKAALLATTENLTIPINYGGGAVGDPPVGTIFIDQASVDRVLADNSWTAFKHIYSVLQALPPNIFHVIDINLAAGVHFADPAATGYYALPVSGFVLNPGGIIRVNGRPVSEWTQIVAPQTITAFQQASNDPWVRVGGTPFAGQDLRGRMAILSNGVFGIINAHDDNTLHIMRAVLPNPTVSVDTVFVGRPNTSIRNALSTTPTTRKSYYSIGLQFNSLAWGANFEFQDIQLEGVGNFQYVVPAFNDNRSVFRRIIIDHEYERTQIGSYGGDEFQTGSGVSIDLWDVGMYASPSHKPPDYPLWSNENGTIYAYATYVCNHTRPAYAYGNRAALYFRNLILDNVGLVSSSSVLIEKGGFFQNWSSMGGAIDEIRNAPGIGIDLVDQGFLDRPDSQLFYFKNVTGPCIRVRTLSRIITTGIGFKNGGGNLDVGIEVVGPSAILQLSPGTDVTGANGDIRFGGVISTYANLVATGPFTDTSFNYLQKLT